MKLRLSQPTETKGEDIQEEDETEDSDEIDPMCESEAVSPKHLRTFKKTQQVNDTNFKLPVIKCPLDEKTTQLKTTGLFKINRSTLSQWIQKHMKVNPSLLKNSCGVKQI